MDSSKPCPETWALHASAQIAAQAMHLARICRNDSPAGCADASPEVFAAMIQAHAMNRIAAALGSLERIATALEAGGAEETQLASAPEQLPVRIGNGWIHGVAPVSSHLVKSWELVKVYDPSQARGWTWLQATEVTMRDLWAPDNVDTSPLFKQLTLQRMGQPQPTSAQEAPRGPAVQAEPVASWGGWRRGCPRWVDSSSSRGFVEVPEGGRLATLPTGRKFRVKDFCAIGAADRWAPIVLVDWSFVEEPASTPTTAPQEPPAGDPDTLVLGTSQERHTGGSEALQGEGEGQDVPEGEQGGREGPVAAPGGHPLDRDGWIRSRLPARGDATPDGDVKVPRGQAWFWHSWHRVTPGQPWAPPTTEPSPYTPQPLPAHLAYPTSEGWIHDRVPGPEDGDEDGEVVVAVAFRRAYAHWSHIVPGQPWQRIF
jgi:hypothetical protein